MGYDRSVYDSVYQILNGRRLQAEQAVERRRTDFYRVEPRGQEIEHELRQAGASAAKAVIRGGNVKKNLDQLKKRSLALQDELKSLLARQSMAPEDLEPHYTCPLCQDRGNVDGRMCSCMKTLLKEEALRQLNAETPLQLSAFADFDLSFYSDTPNKNGHSARSIMENIFLYCRNYAENFDVKTSESLLMTGKTGVGKTHLSLAIASRIIERGYGVLYGSAENLLTKLQDEHFGRSSNDTMKSLLDCDLLILDDLGTEFRSNFTISAIYNIINSRQLTRKPVIISTNLSIKELEQSYTERFSSRIIGGYTRLPFCGNDIRQLKRIRNS
ncbi:MAG TPA: ATP-binding protein [Ruminococcaceae bacterium]|jgi:DNA replication protein DnaC|nr:ATP-binding protein [Oscillospiraceae bacterium]HCC02805.1 ATP-binding protein [Oscillospiraceae bacterium]HCM22948.1 ATP-binding protein [Oscillospiraceae bacterium]